MHLPRLFLFLFSYLFISIALALPSDNEQIIQITADSSTIDYKTGKNIYEGHVKISQGTTNLIADKLITYNNDKHKIKEAIAYGIQKPAEYSTLPKLNDPVLRATASIIRFYPLKSLAILEGNVIVKQGKNNFQGPLLVYNIKDQIVTAPPSKQGRATIIVDPKV